MSQMTKFMVVHNAPEMSCEEVQGNWRKLANMASAQWIRTYYNREKGLRYCVWLAGKEDELREIFRQMNIGWDTIVTVDEVTPDLWGEKWQQHIAQEAVADTLGN